MDIQITFTSEEHEALRQMLQDWVNEELTRPPYPKPIGSVLDKVGGIEIPQDSKFPPMIPNLG